MKRGSGILLAISSLPGQFGIGTMGKSAFRFVDKLKRSGQTYWQMLPITPTGYGDSPYQSLSSFAGNPYYIDFEALWRAGFISRGELTQCMEAFGENTGSADYEAQRDHKYRLLRLAFERSFEKHRRDFIDFKDVNASWINDYAMFMAIKDSQGGIPFWEWPVELKERDPGALMRVARTLETDIAFYQFTQYLFFLQWDDLKRYANEAGVSLVGDMPIYVSPDSADAWAHPEVFDKNGDVAGVPPDYFAKEGQLWGNPLYDWDYLRSTGYAWWMERLGFTLELFDYVRIDHFRGFEEYYAIPAGAATAAEGEWRQGPGEEFFVALKNRYGEMNIIAEDLGLLTDSFFQFMDRCSFPGLKVLQFAFDPEGDSMYLPHNAPRNSVMYTGTHDNDTTLGWYEKLSKAEKQFLTDYVGKVSKSDVVKTLIRVAMASVSDLCMIPMQDVLGLNSEARMNTPATPSGNWRWRMADDQFDTVTINWLKKQVKVYGR